MAVAGRAGRENSVPALRTDLAAASGPDPGKQAPQLRQRVTFDAVPTSRLRRRGITGITLLIVALTVVGLYVAFQRVAPLIKGSGCEAKGTGLVMPLGTGQAAIAATIAGVAQRDALPARAVTVAYAAALQESKLENLKYGDRDSVGVFQQRPSEGWGKRSQLEDPVYATSKFFGALGKVPGYQHLPVYQAAQAVQHSADGDAYKQFQPMATHLASAFTGQDPHAVWCWYAQKIGKKARVGAASLELRKTFGPHATRPTADPGLIVHVGSTSEGWAVAAWLVSHAQQYQIADVRFDGYQWTAANGARGWSRSLFPARPKSIELG